MIPVRIELWEPDSNGRGWRVKGTVARAASWGKAKAKAEELLGMSYETTTQHPRVKPFCCLFRGAGIDSCTARKRGKRVVHVSQPVTYVPSVGEVGYW